LIALPAPLWATQAGPVGEMGGNVTVTNVAPPGVNGCIASGIFVGKQQ
jgi:hypothetical protein